MPYHSANVRERRSSRPASSAARSSGHAVRGDAARRRRRRHDRAGTPRRPSPRVNSSRITASATGRSVPGRTGRCRSAIRASGVRRGSIDDQPRAILLRALDVTDQVDARRRRVAAPDDDQLRVGVVVVRHARHLAVHRRGGGARGRGAQRARQARGAEAPEEARVLEVVGQQAVRPAVVVGKHGRGAEPIRAPRSSC